MAVIVCPICSTRYRVTDAQLSKASRLKCKKCKTVFPVSDNIRDEDTIDESDSSTASPPESEPPSFSGSLDLPGPQDSQSDQEEPEDTAADSEAMTLDFNFASMGGAENAAPAMDFSFSAVMPEAPDEDDDEDTGEDVALDDHIADSLHGDQGQLDVGLGDLSLSGGPDDGESTLSMDGGGSNLDFSFSAVMPEAPPDDEEGDDESYEEDEGGEESGGMQDLSLGLDLGAPPDDATMTMSESTSETASSMNLDISLTEKSVDTEDDDENNDSDDGGGYAEEQEELDTCCVDSLAMGMTTCELCGRDLQGADSQEFAQQRREQLREEMLDGETQIGFSGEGVAEGEASPILPSDDDDFSDVERALDALADGSFEKQIKKREAKKNRGNRLKFIVIGIVAGIIIIIGGGVLLLPSSHEHLAKQYEELMAQPEPDPKTLVALFLDAAAKQDQEIFGHLSVMPSMPDISGGSVVTVGEEYERTSLGQLGKDAAELKVELEALQATYQSTEEQWQEAGAVDLSPNLIKGNIDQLLGKQATLQAEFDEKAQASLQKTISLQIEIQEAEEERDANRLRAQQYIDAIDKQEKAMYTASVRKQQSLSDKIGKLEGLLADEQSSHANRRNALEAEYNPQFQKITEELAVQRELYDMAVLYADSERSPLVVLDIKLKELKNTMVEKEQILQQKAQQLSTAFTFFKRQARRQQAEQHSNDAEFVHISKNVVALVNFKGIGKREVPIVLKRYQGIVGDQTIQGDWVVEAILR